VTDPRFVCQVCAAQTDSIRPCRGVWLCSACASIADALTPTAFAQRARDARACNDRDEALRLESLQRAAETLQARPRLSTRNPS
jgi:predicted RNA-binding protein YlxR (DUF448 family)